MGSGTIFRSPFYQNRLLLLLSMKINIVLIVSFLLAPHIVFAQNQANIWHFGKRTGLNFNSGEPEIVPNVTIEYANASSTMSDEEGNFLFSTNANEIVDKNGMTMQNGDSIIGNTNSSQGALIVQKPGSDNLYYVFTISSQYNQIGLHYSIVDINLNGGLGAVTDQKNILVDNTLDAYEKLIAVRHSNNKDVWIIVRKFTEDSFAAFLLTQEGLSSSPVISPTIDRNISTGGGIGTMKVSFDKKYLVIAYKYEGSILYYNKCFDINKFDAETGQINFMYRLNKNTGPSDVGKEPFAVEFSPDSKFIYTTIYNDGYSDRMELYQYDMQFIEDSSSFLQSEEFIAAGPVNGLQLARDGKIYCTGVNYLKYDYISVINKPWEKGTACDFQADAIYMGFETVYNFLPNMLLDYLLRFEWDNNCSGIPINFKPNFIPEPQSIQWNFGDGTATSSDLWPVHTYDQSGEYEVGVVVQYPNGRIERTSRVIEIKASPIVDLGSDIQICKGSDLELNAGNDPGFYVWSTGVFGDNLLA